MKALTLWQPWASLVALKVKTIETRSWRAPASLIGERIAIHAAARPMDDIGLDLLDAADWPLSVPEIPLGAVVATAVLTDCLPIEGANEMGYDEFVCPHIGGGLTLYRFGNGGWCPATVEDDVSDQEPFGDFTGGRYAWLLDDVRTSLLCVSCDGTGKYAEHHDYQTEILGCPDCEGTGDVPFPIPAKGAQRVWEWTP